MLRALTAFFHSMFLRTAFCSQGEHKRETISHDRWSYLAFRCMDCGRERQLGAVYRYGSNKEVRS
jgi:hypothetical protein